jgi:adenosylcobinamide-phosphate synthase
MEMVNRCTLIIEQLFIVNYSLLIIIVGYLLDLLLGDPRWLPHPIRLFGNVIAWFEKILNKGNYKLWKGALLTIGLCLLAFSFFYSVQKLLLHFIPAPTGTLLYMLFTSIFVFYGLANRSLLQEGREVFMELKNKGLDAGRKRLSWIVGRDTTNLSENQIRVAVFETLSENLSDGVIAPLFYYAIGGLPAMMVYKMINTLDSMIGYKNERYLLFGKCAARLDDVANFIPARLTALLMVMVSGSKRGLLFIIKFGNKHASPNSGYPEAALAGILNCRFGGSNTYQGQLVNKPFIGEVARTIDHEEFNKIFFINHAVTLLCVTTIIFLCCYLK